MPTALFRRNSAMQCFFCHSAVTTTRDPRHFRCPSCGCWNRYDDKGEILSDEPAMHDEQLNARSFAKRASPRKDRLPTMYGKGPFCHTCQTNQMLLVNLLSNYLPPTTSPTYEQRLEMLPEYRESLHLRYPPVCENCLPAVEEEIRNKDNMARTKALGGWLKESKGKDRQRRVSGTLKEREKIGTQIIAWRIRGVLWVTSLITAAIGDFFGARGYTFPRLLVGTTPALPLITFISLLWTAWDPTYSAFRNAQIQGRDVRVQGKNTYITLQMMAWGIRLLTSCFIALQWYNPHLDFLHLRQRPSARGALYFYISLIAEISIFISSCLVLRLQQPPTIRLIDSSTRNGSLSRSSTPLDSFSRSGTPLPHTSSPVPEPDLFSSLSLSSKPVIAAKAPVFGLPSLGSAPPVAPEDTDEMDWTPSDPNATSRSSGARARVADDASWLRPQRFFAPEKPTGLEDLFTRTKLDDVTMTDVSQTSSSASAAVARVMSIVVHHLRKRWWLYLCLISVCGGVGFKVWRDKVIREAQSSFGSPVYGPPVYLREESAQE